MSEKNKLSTRVLVIDDDAALRFTLDAVLGDAGLSVVLADGGAAGIARFETQGADVVVTDLAMPDVDGMAVLAKLRSLDPAVPVIILTAHGSERVAVAAMKAGAHDYLPKPFDPEEVVLAVQRAAETRELRMENARLRAEASLGRQVVADSPALRRVLDMVSRIAAKDITVLLQGESGSGKDVIATAIHAHSHRARKNIVRFNAAALPSELAEAELFGYAKGAFTGAVMSRLGYFQQAHGGTLFIDEIGELSLAIQAKILRALQSGEVQPVGGKPEVVDVRLIVATNRDLGAEVKAGRFREDLFYRLNVVPLRVPPLRERVEDIEPLTRAFMNSYGERYGVTDLSIDADLIGAFRTHPWPGNVRELENTVARLVALTPDNRLTIALWRALADQAQSPQSQDPGASLPFRARVDAFERSLVVAEFEDAKGNQSETARRLGISRPALIEKLHKYGLLRRST